MLNYFTAGESHGEALVAFLSGMPAGLAGALEYNFPEARYVLERASARESAARVAIGAIAKLFLRELGIEVLSHVVTTGSVSLSEEVQWERIRVLHEREDVLLNCAD